MDQGSDGDRKRDSFALVRTEPKVELSPAALSYGSQEVGTTTTQSLITTNRGDGRLRISDVALEGSEQGDFAVAANDYPADGLPSSGRCAVVIRFAPRFVGARAASLKIVDNAAGSPHRVAISGNGIASALHLGEASLEFGEHEVGGIGSLQHLSVTNGGSSPLRVSEVRIEGAHPGDFAITSNTCLERALAPGESCSVTIRFIPSVAGHREALLKLVSNAAGSSHSVSLSGSGTGAVVELSRSSVDFGDRPVGSASGVETVSVTNRGRVTLRISALSMGGDQAGDFAVDSTNCAGGTLAPGSSCSIGIRFNPAASGTRSAELRIYDNATDSPQRVTLAGRGVASSVELSRTRIDFADQRVGTSSEHPEGVGVTNAGTAPLRIVAVSIEGSHRQDFRLYSQTCQGTTLSPRQDCSVLVSFAPSASGTRSAYLSIAHDGQGSPHVVILSGKGTVPALGVSPERLDFGEHVLSDDLALANPAVRAVTVTSTGSAPVPIGQVVVEGPNARDFTIEGSECQNRTLSPGGQVLDHGPLCARRDRPAVGDPGHLARRFRQLGAGGALRSRQDPRRREPRVLTQSLELRPGGHPGGDGGRDDARRRTAELRGWRHGVGHRPNRRRQGQPHRGHAGGGGALPHRLLSGRRHRRA